MFPSTSDTSDGAQQNPPQMSSWARMRAERKNKTSRLTPGGYIPCPHCGKELDLPALEREAAKRQDVNMDAGPATENGAEEEVLAAPPWEQAAWPPANEELATSPVADRWDARPDSMPVAASEAPVNCNFAGVDVTDKARDGGEVIEAATEEPAVPGGKAAARPVTVNGAVGTSNCPSCTYGVLQIIPASFVFRALGAVAGLHPHNEMCGLCEYRVFRWRPAPQQENVLQAESAGEGATSASASTKEIDLSSATIDELLQMVVQQATFEQDNGGGRSAA